MKSAKRELRRFDERDSGISQVRARTGAPSPDSVSCQSVPAVRAPEHGERASRQWIASRPLLFGLAFIGGVLGGTMGGGAMLVESYIASSDGPSWIKALAILWVAFGTVMLLLAGLWVIHMLLRRAAH